MPPGCYAVLARVSPGYPPLEGRLATCYSPVRHFTHPDVLLHPNFLVRLACVRHAASVDSEPGSNSRLKLGLRPVAPGFSPARLGGCRPKRAALQRAVTWEFPCPYTAEQENIACPIPSHRNGTCRSALRLSSCASRRVETNPAPQKPRCIDVACSTQLSKSGPARRLTSGPHAGAQPGTRRRLLTPPVSPGCRTLKADSTTVQLANLRIRRRRCQERRF